MILDVVVSEGPAIERERNTPGFARIQLHLRESLQFLHGPGNQGMRFAHVHFGNFGAGTMAGVRHLEADGNGLISRNGGRSHCEVPVGERRIRKSVAERELRLDGGLVEVTVSNEQTLFIFGSSVSCFGIVVVVRGIVFPTALKRDGQLARWTV